METATRLDEDRAQFDDRLSRIERSEFSNTTLADFDISRVLGVGSFGKVLLVQGKTGSKAFAACKIISKERVIKTKQVEHTVNEKNILYCMTSAFVVRLFDFFQDQKNIYLMLEFVNGGEMFSVLQRQRRRRWAPRARPTAVRAAG